MAECTQHKHGQENLLWNASSLETIIISAHRTILDISDMYETPGYEALEQCKMFS